MFMDTPWWYFCIISILVFLACLFLNYIMKKINEIRMEERFTKLLDKASNTQGTQVQEVGLDIEKTKLKKIPSTHNAEKGISLVFNKEDNILRAIKRKKDTTDIKRPKPWELEDISEISQRPEDALYQKISIISVKRSKLEQNSEHNKRKFLGCVVIKDSKEECANTNNGDETVSVKTTDSYLKKHQLEPETAKTNLGSIIIKDSKELFTKANTTTVSMAAIPQNPDEILIHKMSGSALEIFKLEAEATETMSDSIFVDDSKVASSITSSKLQISQTSPDTQEALSLRISNNLLKTDNPKQGASDRIIDGNPDKVSSKDLNKDYATTSSWNTYETLSGMTSESVSLDTNQEPEAMDENCSISLSIDPGNESTSPDNPSNRTSEVLPATQGTQPQHPSDCSIKKKSELFPKISDNSSKGDELKPESTSGRLIINDFVVAFSNSPISEPQTSRTERTLIHKTYNSRNRYKKLKDLWESFLLKTST